MPRQPGFWSVEDRLGELLAHGDPREKLRQIVDFELFRPVLIEALGPGNRSKGGQIVDASLVAAPRQRNTEEEKAAIKAGKTARQIWPDHPHKAAQKDTDARWMVKTRKGTLEADGTVKRDIAIPVFGYKTHISIDRRHGFDPRSTAVATRLTATNAPVHALYIQENRPNPAQDLLDRANANTEALLAGIAHREIVSVDIFGTDGAVTGGRNVIAVLGRQNFDGVTDVVIDISALSVGCR